VGEANAYRQLTKGVGVTLGTRLETFLPGIGNWAHFTSYAVGYNFRIVQIIGGKNITFRDTTPQLTSTLNQTLGYSTVNHPFKPTQGTKLSFSFEYGGWQFDSDKPFYRCTWEYSKFATFAERHTFAANVTYGYIRNLSNDDLPIWDMYRPGGENSIRGYMIGQVGSTTTNEVPYPVVIGGNKQFIANLEYQFKVADQFRTVLFYDTGDAWGPGTKVFSEGMRKSTGVELRFFLPISPAPLRLIWAHKIDPYWFDHSNRNDFQFSIGTTF
jgi:outer membrane protein insertion porin family